MRKRSNSPPYEKRRSPVRRDRRELPSRRRRSFSRDRLDGSRPRRSSPSFKRSRREDDHFDRYDRVSPFRRGYDRDRVEDRDARDGYDRAGYHDKRSGPDSYREFILHLPNDVTPEEAHRRYQNYLTDWYGSLAKSEFEQYKNEEWMKLKNDPRSAIQIIDKHKEYAQEAARKLADELKTNKELDIHSEEFDQGVSKPAEPEPDVGEKTTEKEFFAPHVCWSIDRVKVDLELSSELVRKLDSEKEITFNPVLDPSPLLESSKKEGEENEEKGEDVEAKQDEEEEKVLARKLDLLLTYLWRVHMVDYYSGHELNDKEYEVTNCRMLRPPKTQQTDEETNKKMLEELAIRVNAFWTDRIKNGDPLEQKAQRARVEKAIEDFVESQVTQIDDKRWGNKLSSKMFIGKEFVLKHIRLKHTSAIDSEKEKILDEIYYENFKKEKEDEERKLAEQKRTNRFDPHAMDVSFNGYGEGFGPSNQGVIGAPIVPAPMMGAPMGQILMPAPGAGPMGPFVLQSVPTASDMTPMSMGPMSGSSRGFDASSNRNPMGLTGSTGSTTTRPWEKQNRYYDLDDPQNNRAVLDYSDL